MPVSVAAVSDATVYGELCVPPGGADTVQLLVHGGSYNHAYFDWPQEQARYSYVRRALAAGYATFNVDRFGYGASSRPISALVSFESGAAALHDVVTQLRSGGIGGRPFSRVVWVGHSLGSIVAWFEGRYHDVDAFVLTANLLPTKPSYLVQAAAAVQPALLDPKFAGAGLDPGYTTTRPGTRGSLFYYPPTSDDTVIARDEELKDTTSATELAELGPIEVSPPQLAPSQAIAVPTLLVVGDHDAAFCGPPDGLDCTRANVVSSQAPYYSQQAQLSAIVADDTGHSLQLHRTAPETAGRILDWIDALRP